MFLNYITNFIVKKTLKNTLKDLKTDSTPACTKTVGLLVDASRLEATELLIPLLVAQGILERNIKTIVFYDVVKKNNGPEYFAFSGAQLKWNGDITAPQINNFINEKFDLLISFYDVEKAILMQITHDSKAQFKVGFASIDKRLNHFIIKTEINKYDIFVNELFKYLKLLNKI